MKKIFLKILLTGVAFGSTAQVSSEDLLNFLGNEKVISQEKIDSLRADIALEQQKSPKDKLFTIDLDYRPRTEMRNGYGQLRTDTTRPTVFTTQRARLGFTFKHENKFGTNLFIKGLCQQLFRTNRHLSGNQIPRSRIFRNVSDFRYQWYGILGLQRQRSECRCCQCES